MGQPPRGRAHAGNIERELLRLGGFPLLIGDEISGIPFDPNAAALLYALISTLHDCGRFSMTSNKTCSAWTEIFGDVVSALANRLVHETEIIMLRGYSHWAGTTRPTSSIAQLMIYAAQNPLASAPKSTAFSGEAANRKMDHCRPP